jgi:hypothetical protein
MVRAVLDWDCRSGPFFGAGDFEGTGRLIGEAAVPLLDGADDDEDNKTKD